MKEERTINDDGDIVAIARAVALHSNAPLYGRLADEIELLRARLRILERRVSDQEEDRMLFSPL